MDGLLWCVASASVAAGKHALHIGAKDLLLFRFQRASDSQLLAWSSLIRHGEHVQHKRGARQGLQIGILVQGPAQCPQLLAATRQVGLNLLWCQWLYDHGRTEQ